ncbi:hypothetical protein [Kamptonema sp. UHCC 0994]|uniref:hypothetical protein n=1 Tax=Kamptonema sp. UHCC 0994 TaxID=3031329 RepID=UPI0023B8B3F8|nr:hypothetical protein [Kamptonema sp. UHCC 0994]MDF0555213.1 hypothetical protein [Kamptonema sp. UHCC 0994]
MEKSREPKWRFKIEISLIAIIINRMRQELAWQCPEIALVQSAKLQDDLPPLLWGWLAELRKSKKYDRIAAVREDSGQKKKGKQSGSALCRKALWQWLFTRIETTKNNPPLVFQYGEERMSPSENLRRRKKGGTPVKLARQRVIARCVRELFKELCAIVQN